MHNGLKSSPPGFRGKFIVMISARRQGFIHFFNKTTGENATRSGYPKKIALSTPKIASPNRLSFNADSRKNSSELFFRNFFKDFC